ncbi:hypothetical protein SNEBB_006760 [Seison nebaliae]|nr:hypothetical protein SNEBB_006760 [Seison nebaliae]
MQSDLLLRNVGRWNEAEKTIETETDCHQPNKCGNACQQMLLDSEKCQQSLQLGNCLFKKMMAIGNQLERISNEKVSECAAIDYLQDMLYEGTSTQLTSEYIGRTKPCRTASGRGTTMKDVSTILTSSPCVRKKLSSVKTDDITVPMDNCEFIEFLTNRNFGKCIVDRRKECPNFRIEEKKLRKKRMKLKTEKQENDICVLKAMFIRYFNQMEQMRHSVDRLENLSEYHQRKFQMIDKRMKYWDGSQLGIYMDSLNMQDSRVRMCEQLKKSIDPCKSKDTRLDFLVSHRLQKEVNAVKDKVWCNNRFAIYDKMNDQLKDKVDDLNETINRLALQNHTLSKIQKTFHPSNGREDCS